MDASTHFRERGALISGLMSGELDAADVVASTRPAVEALGLLVPIDGLMERYLHGRRPEGLSVTSSEFEPWRRQLLAVVAALLERWIGDDRDLWLALAMRAGAYHGTVVEMLESVVRPELADPSSWAGRAPRWPRGVDASAVLLAMAPPGIVEAFLDECVTSEAAGGVLTRMLDRGPVHPRFMQYAIGSLGTQAMWLAAYRNPGYKISQLRQQVLQYPTDIVLLEHAYLYAEEADRGLRVACVRLAEAVGGFRPRFLDALEHRQEAMELQEPLLVSGDPALLLPALRRVTTRVPALRRAAYATLARLAGPEPVWAMEQERAGTLARMDTSVRESMASGTSGPILAAAEATPVSIGPAGSAMALGAPVIEPWPYTELIREHVEGNARRQDLIKDLAVDRAAL